MSKHTPGPWRVEYGTTLIWGACNPDDRTTWGMGYPILDRATRANASGGRPTEAEREANAYLAAAAPDLLNGCNALLGLLQLLAQRDDITPEIREFLTGGHRIDEARAAIAKTRPLP